MCIFPISKNLSSIQYFLVSETSKLSHGLPGSCWGSPIESRVFVHFFFDFPIASVFLHEIYLVADIVHRGLQKGVHQGGIVSFHFGISRLEIYFPQRSISLIPRRQIHKVGDISLFKFPFSKHNS